MRQTFQFVTQYPLRNELKIFVPAACPPHVFCLPTASQPSNCLFFIGKQSSLLALRCVFLFVGSAMYAKVIDPKTNGQKVYNNSGSTRWLTNYLSQEAKESGRPLLFFDGSGEKTVEQVVAMLDSNHKGLRKDDAKFYSLVLSPSSEELSYMGNDPNSLEKYTQNVMDDYAKNFTLKNGKKLGEPNLVWAATIHQDRKNRGTDEGVQGERKEGLQTHIHVIVSARDAEQKITLNPLSTPDRFNRVQFQAKAGAEFEIQFGRMGNHNLMKPEPTRKELIAEKAEEITTKAAANKREKKPLTEQQIAAKDARLDTQVARVNFKLDASQQLDPEQVKQAAKARNYDDIFYRRLGNVERNAEKGIYTPSPHQYLTTGRVVQLAALQVTVGGPPVRAVRSVQPEQLAAPSMSAGLRALEQAASRLARAMTPASKTQDVRNETEKEADKEQEQGW